MQESEVAAAPMIEAVVDAAAQHLYLALQGAGRTDPGAVLARFLDLDLCMGLLPDRSPLAVSWTSAARVLDGAPSLHQPLGSGLYPVRIQDSETVYILSLRARHVLVQYLDAALARPDTDLPSLILIMSHILDRPVLYHRYVTAVKRRAEAQMRDLGRTSGQVCDRTGRVDGDVILYRTLFASIKSEIDFLDDLYVQPITAQLRYYLRQHLYDDDIVDVLLRAWAVLDPVVDQLRARCPTLGLAPIYQRVLSMVSDFEDVCAECFARVEAIAAAAVTAEMESGPGLGRDRPAVGQPGPLLIRTWMALQPGLALSALNRRIVDRLLASITALCDGAGVPTTPSIQYHITLINAFHRIRAVTNTARDRYHRDQIDPPVLALFEGIITHLHQERDRAYHQLIRTCTGVYRDLIQPALDMIDWERPGRTRPVPVDHVSDALLVLNLFLHGLDQDLRHLRAAMERRQVVFGAVLVQCAAMMRTRYRQYEPGVAMRHQYGVDISFMSQLLESVRISDRIEDADRDAVRDMAESIRALAPSPQPPLTSFPPSPLTATAPWGGGGQHDRAQLEPHQAMTCAGRCVTSSRNPIRIRYLPVAVADNPGASTAVLLRIRMEQRMYPWRDRPGDLVADRIGKAQSSRLFLVQERGPTSFVVMGEGGDGVPGTNNRRRYRVLIGTPQTCSCRDPADLCVHLLFIMIKVLRLSPHNPLVWQKALLDREIVEILSGKHAAAAAAGAGVDPRPRKAASSRPGERGVFQREIASDDLCSICMDALRDGAQALTFCRSGCGNSVHQECMRIWAQYRESIGEQVSCPLCRAPDWGRLPPKPKARSPASMGGQTHRHSQCAGCSGRVSGARYTCAFCDRYDLCQVCARTQILRHHHGSDAIFVKSSPAHRFHPVSNAADLHHALMSLLPPDAKQPVACAFCTDAKDGVVVKMPCRHRAHRQCLVDRLSQDECHTACPIDCKVVFPGLLPRTPPPPHQQQQQRTQQSRGAIRFGRRAPGQHVAGGTGVELSLAGHGLSYCSR